jgi:hypothetical protein
MEMLRPGWRQTGSVRTSLGSSAARRAGSIPVSRTRSESLGNWKGQGRGRRGGSCNLSTPILKLAPRCWLLGGAPRGGRGDPSAAASGRRLDGLERPYRLPPSAVGESLAVAGPPPPRPDEDAEARELVVLVGGRPHVGPFAPHRCLNHRIYSVNGAVTDVRAWRAKTGHTR